MEDILPERPEIQNGGPAAGVVEVGIDAVVIRGGRDSDGAVIGPGAGVEGGGGGDAYGGVFGAYLRDGVVEVVGFLVVEEVGSLGWGGSISKPCMDYLRDGKVVHTHRSLFPGKSMLEPSGRAGPWSVHGPSMLGAVAVWRPSFVVKR